LAVGDVAGKGLGPATVMGRTRTALRAYALETDSPALVLGRVHRMLRQFEDEQMVTVIYGVLNPVEKTIVMCSAGHLPPLLALPDGSTEYVDIEPGPPMGLGPELERRDVSLEIPEGATLFLYTDGLIERRGVPMDQGLEQLSRVVSTRPAEEACAEILQALMGNESLLDDIALLAVRRLAEEPEAPVS
jgi:serine phosphatase RsbU (regulator of sigma subunit)